jgi:cephalosporin hydroxylase
MNLEEALDQPLREILPLMQQRMLHRSTYFGVPAVKNPNDFWVYQEILHAQRPDFIVEIGNYYGGSTLALAHLCDLLGHGRVIGLDISHAHLPAVVRAHPRITLLEGDACALFNQVRQMIAPAENVLVIEDSSHTYENTLNVLRTYHPLIPRGGYFIIEDGICHHGLDEGPKPGPYEAIDTFIAETPSFVIDREQEDFLITWNPKGFLKRIR